MKRTVLVLICLILTAWSRSTTAQYSGMDDEGFQFSISSDWQPVPGSNDSQFIRKGDRANNWKELITIEYFSRKSVDADSPGAFLDGMKGPQGKGMPQPDPVERDPAR
jgi:hypothetical protein